MPPGFTLIGQRADFLIPYGWTMERLRSAPGRGSSYGLARLRDGVSFEQAESDMKNIAAALEKEFPERDAGWSITLVPVHEQMVDQIRPALRVLGGAVGLVLLIACVNVANLLLARGAVRARELGLRAALGAKRGRLIRQLITESLLLGSLGGIAGLALAWALSPRPVGARGQPDSGAASRSGVARRPGARVHHRARDGDGTDLRLHSRGDRVTRSQRFDARRRPPRRRPALAPRARARS